MNRLIIWITLLSATAFAKENVYHLNMDLTMDNRTVSMGLIVAEGQNGKIMETIDGKSTFVKVVVNEDKANQAINMSFVLGHIINGREVVKSSPRIVTLENERAEISQADKNGENVYKLGVVVTRE